MENDDMSVQSEDELSCIWRKKKIQKPNYWRKISIVSFLCALLMDPLFFYIPILKDDIKCIMLDPKLKITVLLLRSVTDIFYLMDIIIQIYRSKNYSDFQLNRRENQMNFSFVLKFGVPTIAKTIWASNDILIDIVALLPLSQVAVFIFFSKMSDLRSLTTTRMVLMNVFALLQYVPRVLRIYLSSKELKEMPLKEKIRETSIWFKRVINFSMYIIACHVVGALWYFFAIQRMMICWHSVCQKDDGCENRIFGCHDHHFLRNTTILNDLCYVNVSDNSSDTMFFDFGIFATVLRNGVVGSTNYFKKFLNCFWWGLRNLSSFGSNLEPSADGWENLYTVFISITGLLLFLYLIGNLQMYMQFESTRRDNNERKMLLKQKMEEKGEEIELLLFKNSVPTRSNRRMKLQIMEKVQQALELEVSREISLDDILSDVEEPIKDQMSLAWLKKVPMLQGMDEGLLKIIYQQLQPMRYPKNNLIIQKGEILEKMVYIVDGFVSIEVRSSDDSRRGAGELCGQELLRWPFSTSFPHTRPLATKSVKASSVVEALVLKACDLQSIYDQPDIKRKEAPRHRRMIKKMMESKIDYLIPRNGIPERLNHDVKSWMMKELFPEDKAVYWDCLAFDGYNFASRLPLSFQKKIKSHTPCTKLKKMPTFEYMNKEVLKEICRHLQPMKYNCTDTIIKNGGTIQMLFIVEGSIGHQGSEKGPGEIYGEELLFWPFSTSFPDGVPTTAESPLVITDVVEVLVLTASDMKSVATEFRKYFIKNYGRLAHNLVNDVCYFTEEFVEEAIRNFTYFYYPNGGGNEPIYHTVLGRIAVAIKTCNNYIQSERLVHEAFVLSHIRHNNVERLFGWCLETRWPIMVYDRTNASTLVEHLHINKLKLSLESRMKIAAETAGALAHVHSRLIVHRDVKTANILIHHTIHTVKVTGFGASRLLHEDEGERVDEVSTLPGTSRCLDPEYLKSHDVYSFGVVLVELLTRQEAVSSDGSETSLANDFVCSVQEGPLGKILDSQINTDQFSLEIAKKVSELAVKCLRSRGEERPSMEQVAAELEEVVETIITR